MKNYEDRLLEDLNHKFQRLKESVLSAEKYLKSANHKGCKKDLERMEDLTKQICLDLTDLKLRTFDGRDCWEATDEEVLKLAKINKNLLIIEEESEKRFKSIVNEMNKNRDYFYEYEIEVKIDIFLDENDSRYDEEDDNILYSIDPIMCMSSDKEIIDWRHSGTFLPIELYITEDHPLYNLDVCPLFFIVIDSAMNRAPLCLDDILRMEDVWVEIIVRHQDIRDVFTLKSSC